MQQNDPFFNDLESEQPPIISDVSIKSNKHSKSNELEESPKAQQTKRKLRGKKKI